MTKPEKKIRIKHFCKCDTFHLNTNNAQKPLIIKTVRLIGFPFSVQPKYFAIEGVGCCMETNGMETYDELTNGKRDAVRAFRWK